MQISLLGSFQVSMPGQPSLSFPTQKVRALLAYLCVEAHTGHARDKLMGIFWQEQNASSASTNLRQTLARLRNVIPHDRIRTRDNEIQFNAEEPCQVDVLRMMELIERGKQRLRTIGKEDEQGWQAFEEAVALYRGDFLAHFALPNAPAFEEWALLKREWLRSEVLRTLSQLTEHYEEAARHDDAIRTARRQLQIDSVAEIAYQQLMRNLARSGRRSEALEQYELCRRMLAQELDVEPARETTHLSEQIRAGEFSNTVDTSRNITSPLQVNQPTEPQSHSSAPLRCNVPVPLTELIGRKPELDQLLTLLVRPSARIITILGPGGIGKTHLALAIAQQIAQNPTSQTQQSFQDGIYWVAFSAITTSDRIVETIAKSLSIELNNYQEPAQQLQTWLRPKRLLLVLDNFEHLVDEVELLVDLLHTAPTLKILTTSRVRLQLQGEHLLALDGLGYPHQQITSNLLLPSAMLEEWLRYDAVELFIQQAQRSQPGFTLQAVDIQTIVAICQKVQGMPLAILLAAGWVNDMALSIIAERVQCNIDFLTQEWRDLPARQRTMRAVLDRTWQLLSSKEQEILQAASLFRAGFTSDAAEKVMGASLRDLTTLVGKSMLQRVVNGRYVMHELLRQYATEKLAQSADQGMAIRASFTNYFAERLAVQGTEYDKPELIKPLLPELDNLHLAWQHILQIGHVEWALQSSHLYLYLVEFYVSRSYLYEILQQFTHYLEQIDEKQPYFYRAQRRLAWLLISQATLSVHLGQHEKTAGLFRRSHEIFNGPAYNAEESLHNRAMAWNEEGRVSIHHRPLYARQLYEQALPIFEQFSDNFWLIGTRTLLANLDFHLGAYQQAEHSFRETLAFEEQQGLVDPYSPTALIKLIGLALFRQGKLHRAQLLLREDLAFAEKSRSSELIGDALPFLGTILYWCGEVEEAQQLISRKLTYFAQAGVPGRTAEAQRTQATIYLHAGDYAQASHYCLQAIETQRLVRDSFALGESFVILSQIRLGEQHLTEAERIVTECITLYLSLGEHGVIGSAYATLGHLLWQQNKVREAKQNLLHALQIAHEWHAFFAALYALPTLALKKLADGEGSQSIELYALLTAQTPVVARSLWFEEIAGRKLVEFQSTLPPELVARAWKRGEEVDMWEAVKQLHDELQTELAIDTNQHDPEIPNYPTRSGM